MARLNVPKPTIYTHEGAPAKQINPELQLRRSVMACLLWEKTFYEDGQDIAQRIAETIPKVKPQVVANIAVEAREKMKLRHVPLLIAREMARIESHKHLTADVLGRIIQRPDELTEFLAIYWKDGKQPLSARVKKGLATAFQKFDEYQLAKYDRGDTIKLRDVLFLCHGKPKNGVVGYTKEARRKGIPLPDGDGHLMFKKLVDGKLDVPDTWEVALSSGGDKKEHWERLLKENRLGALALLRNLRNMEQAKVDDRIVFSALETINVSRVLPFRFIAAARAVPQWEDRIEPAMMKALAGREKMTGKTILLVDRSGSMSDMLSAKSDMSRFDAGCALAILLREVCEHIMMFAFNHEIQLIPPRHGFALRDAFEMPYNGTYLGLAIADLNNSYEYDRLIVITDEQSHDKVPDPKGKGYMINVASYQNGVGYGAWTHIDGWSEAVIDYINTVEQFSSCRPPEQTPGAFLF
uniref:Putative TROVE domain containing protein n=1 Tax=viral metagenome TaxID=1070528 RepID=A0A6M3KFA9_9ZZZZ